MILTNPLSSFEDLIYLHFDDIFFSLSEYWFWVLAVNLVIGHVIIIPRLERDGVGITVHLEMNKRTCTFYSQQKYKVGTINFKSFSCSIITPPGRIRISTSSKNSTNLIT
ncbi:uncharacterized protein OCT59_000917 [Rhizophagus irregularis]|uniref:uncharacterized protein n=1 Tax=Rhizophagus irregularis TaxID=588596 RepID=UPI0019E958FD|nr:hypothetical protein OCT59_000917 [Rhizophagus irregularis]GET60909.1 hypothetical protein RIR_jg10591.t1 [Rhizophagus irregularis DAOM 181602=DAOM 197198]CAG8465775.1 17552_t:CDS:1 [Rhizophagus irregularis]